MSGRIGADPESLDSLADQLRGFSETLRSSRRNLTSGVHDRAWKGARADRFRSDWDHTYVPWIDSTCEFLDHATAVLHDNANQQRVASGGTPKDYGSTGPQSLWGRAVHGVESLADKGHDWVIDRVKDGERELREVGSAVTAGLSEIATSPYFDQVMEVAQVVSTVAPLLAIVPGLGQAALVVGAVASAVVLAGHVCQMANTGQWDYKKLAVDGVGTALAFAGVGALGKAAQGASEVNLMTHAGRTYQTGSFAANTASNVLVLRGAKDLYDLGDTSYQVTTDVLDGHYADAALDSFGFVATGTGAAGDGVADQVSLLTDGTQKVVDFAQDQQ